MNLMSKWKELSIVAVLVLGVVFLIPSFQWYSMDKQQQDTLKKTDYGKWKKLNENKLNLGLDLQGGVSLLLRVDTDALETMAMEQEIERINQELSSKQFPQQVTLSANSTSITVAYTNDEEAKQITQVATAGGYLMQKQAPEGTLEFTIAPDKLSYKTQETVENARRVIENRVNELGLSETMVAIVNTDRITVQLPGETDPDRATKLIQKQAFLEFKLVADDVLINSVIDANGQVRPGAMIPDGYELKYLKDVRNGSITNTPILVKKRAELTGDKLTGAKVSRDSMSMGMPYVSMTFDKEGAVQFERITGMNVNKRLAIVLDGEVKSAPNIQARISGGSAQITGQFSEQEAKDLALVLKSGALPAPLVVEESNVVGPTLGLDSIHKGVQSALIGGLLVILFMIIYYRFSGVIATVALTLNIVLLLAGMAILHATLTVPGIAGMILTIGMAVDANVLIFERIREELRTGKTPRAAIEAGYGRAFSAILDSNITTIISAFMLLQFGSSAVKGFAITLMIGLAISMYTAILVTRVIFDKISLRPGYKKISI